MRADLVVEGDRLDDVEELALVFVDALDLDVEHGRGIDAHAHAAADELGELHLVLALHRRELLLEGGIVGEGLEFMQRFRIVHEPVADRLADQRGEAGIALHQPAARRDAVGLVVDPLGIERVEVGKDRDLHEFRVERGDAVDGMGADEGEVAHPDAAVAVLVDQRDGSDLLVVEVPGLAGLEQDLRVDRVDDLHVAGQKPLEERHRPAFQRLGQERVVGIGERAAGDLPGLVEFQSVDVGQQAHHLGDGNRRMGVVQLDRHLVGQVGEVRVLLQVAAQDVLQGRRREEVFLAQPQLLARRIGVGRVEDAGEGLGLVALAQRADVVAGIEGVEQDRVDRVGRPEPQGVDPLGPPADDRRVVGGCNHPLGGLPDIARRFFVAADGFHRTAEADLVGAFAPLELPRVAVGKPGLRQLDLPAIRHLLAEEAVDIADAVAIGGDVDRGHGFHEAGGEAAEAAIAERRIGLEAGDDVEIDAEGGERIAQFVHDAEIGDGVAHQPADQEFQREVIDPLVAVLIGAARRFHPAVDDAVTHHEDGGGQPVVRLGDLGILADAVGQALDDLFGEYFGAGTAGAGLRDFHGREAIIHGMPTLPVGRLGGDLREPSVSNFGASLCTDARGWQ